MISSDKTKTYQALAVIGNGFDMAHGYHTDYKSFAQNTSNPNMEWFRSYCENDDSITTWYLFEENIKILSQKLLVQSYGENVDFDDNRNEVNWLRNVYREIQNLLIQYLKSETLHKPVVKLASIEKYLNEKTKVINFNYTKIAEEYSNDVFYVHGSLDENDILLGYDYRDELCITQYEDRCFSKILCREELAFRRYLRQECNLNSDSEAYKQLISSLELYQHWKNSNRGLDEEVETFIPKFHIIDQFMQKHKTHKEIPEMNYDRISTLIVMGHGIEADQVFLKKIVCECVNLKEIIIFRYHGEDDNSIKKKKQFFEPYCRDIQEVYY